MQYLQRKTVFWPHIKTSLKINLTFKTIIDPVRTIAGVSFIMHEIQNYKFFFFDIKKKIINQFHQKDMRLKFCEIKGRLIYQHTK